VVQKLTGIKMYNTLALTTLSGESKNWKMKAKDKTRITAAEMKFMRTAKYAWMGCKRNEDMLKELKTEQNLYWTKFSNIKPVGFKC
jgi:hypothetical protein